MNTGQITDPSIRIKPSKKLIEYVKKVNVSNDLPLGIANIVFKNKVNKSPLKRPTEPVYLITEKDRQFIKSLKLNTKVTSNQLPLNDEAIILENDKLLNLQEIHWLHNYIRQENLDKTTKIYFHELFEGSEIILPKNVQIPRNEELEKRCEQLRNSQHNAMYHNMTKNVDNVRKHHPEDTIAFQLQQMNRQLIAIFQFIISVLAGFAFGFIGVELIIGNLDFGFRLLLGIICALTIALAELYFLAKKLNEDLKFETAMEQRKKTTKLD